MPFNPEIYNETISRIREQTRDELWTMPVATLVLLLAGIFGMTVLVNVVFYSFAHWILAVAVYALESAALAYVIYRHRQKVEDRVREKIAGMESTHPGISEAYAERRKKS